MRALRCVKMELGGPDDSGRRRPVPVAGSEFEYDMVVFAIGTNANPILGQTSKLKLNRRGHIETDQDLATSIAGVYAGGDIVTGAATVIEAMGAGRRAARSIKADLGLRDSDAVYATDTGTALKEAGYRVYEVPLERECRAQMATALPRLTDMVDYIWQKSAALGIANRILVRIYSEFGRTPLNNSNGKDHWSVGSQVLMEAAPAWGNRVFGASGPRHQALRINPATGALDATNGIIITPRHIHAALRTYLGINTTDPRFDLKVPANELFAFFDPNARSGYPTL